jgi:hypothetical protein
MVHFYTEIITHKSEIGNSQSEIQNVCPEGDSNPYGFPPPPQDGASANFATWAKKIKYILFFYKLYLLKVSAKSII